MSIEAKREYLIAIRERYRNSNRKEKKVILGEFCDVCKYSRKYAIRILNLNREDLVWRRRGPPVIYGDQELGQHLRALWLATGQVCSKKLKVALKDWLPFYPGRAHMSDQTLELLQRMSPATIDRLLKRYRDSHRKGLSGTKQQINRIKNRIPIQLVVGREITQPGFVEGDTVAHCGDRLQGQFVNSLTLTDIYSCWTENRALWNKNRKGVIDALTSIEKALPFALTCFACDNGSEFLNYELLAYFRTNRAQPIEFVRRRPYKKNDNAHVEQKNWTHVRQLLGYDRLDDEQQVILLNEIYEHYWNPLHNFFTPAMKMIEKTRVGGRIVKKYDAPQTPYQRLMDCKDLPIGSKESLKNRFDSLNPFELRKGLERKLKEFSESLNRRRFRLVG